MRQNINSIHKTHQSIVCLDYSDESFTKLPIVFVHESRKDGTGKHFSQTSRAIVPLEEVLNGFFNAEKRTAKKYHVHLMQ